MNITTIGIDLAKSVFQLHGIDSSGKVLVKKQIKRAQMAEYLYPSGQHMLNED